MLSVLYISAILKAIIDTVFFLLAIYYLTKFIKAFSQTKIAINILYLMNFVALVSFFLGQVIRDTLFPVRNIDSILTPDSIMRHFIETNYT